jgi:hypothetical protein
MNNNMGNSRRAFCTARIAVTLVAACIAIGGCGPRNDRAKQSKQAQKAVVLSSNISATDLLLAFKAAYGQPAPVALETNQPDAGGEVTLAVNPIALIPVAPGIIALIAKGENETHDCGRFCTGQLDIHYLRRNANGFELLGSWKDVAGPSQFGSAPTWNIRNDLFTGPALVAISDAGGGGCGVEEAQILELTPLRPIVRASQVLLDSQGENGKVETSINPIERGKSFQVIYRGAVKAEEMWTILGDEYLGQGTEKIKPIC